MRRLGIQGVRKGKQVITTRPDGQADRHPDLVGRAFVAERRRRLVGHRPDLRADLVGCGLRVLHHRCVLPQDRGMASRHQHAHHHGYAGPGDGPVVSWDTAGGAGVSLRRRQPGRIQVVVATPHDGGG